MYHRALVGKFPHVWDPPQVLFSGHGTEATDVKAREKSAVKIVCHLLAVLCGRKVNCLIFFIFAELGSFRFV